MSKALAAAAGGVVLVGGGAVAIKYGTSLFDGSDSSQIKIWLDENGNCKYEERISGPLEKDKKLSGSQDNLCLQLSQGTLDWSKVTIDEERMNEKYKSTVKDKDTWLQNVKSQSS